ncbi:MAG: hypothetical protein ACR5KV_06565 [Wolbachia sp.]
MLLSFGLTKIQASLYSAILDSNLQKIKNILNSNPDNNIQKVLRSLFLNNRTILDVAKSMENEEIIQELQQKASEHTNELWNNRREIQNSLRLAVVNSNLQEVQSILNSNSNSYIQKILVSKFDGDYTILDIATIEKKKISLRNFGRKLTKTLVFY